MKKFSLISLVLVLTSFILSNFLINSNLGFAYWSPGNGDCETEHGISRLNATFIESPNIILDGIGDESCWASSNVSEYLIPTATLNGSGTFFKAYVRFRFVYDLNYFYINAWWNDTTIIPPDAYQDAISLCWNINVTNFTAGIFVQPDLMATMNAGEMVDNWKWPRRDFANQTVIPPKDQSFGSNGWNDFTKETQDVSSCFTYGTLPNGTSNYRVEFKRALRNSDAKDVQFDHNGTYRFTVAVLNDLGGEDHAISWTYELGFDNLYIPVASNPDATPNPDPTINSYSVMNIVIMFTIGIGLEIAIIRKNKKKSGAQE